MPVDLTDIIALRKKLDLDRKKIEERDHALAIVEEMLREVRAEEPGRHPELPLPAPAPAQTFTEGVRESVQQFGDEEFTVQSIETLLKGRGIKLPAGKPRARISMILSEMAKKGLVRITHKGSGNSPHRYRRVMQANGRAEHSARNEGPVVEHRALS